MKYDCPQPRTGDVLEFSEGPGTWTVLDVSLTSFSVRSEGGTRPWVIDFRSFQTPWRKKVWVGDRIRITFRDNECDRDFTVAEDKGTFFLCDGGLNWIYHLPKDDADYTVHHLSTAAAPTPTVKGSTCRRPNCPEPFNEYAEPTRLEDRTHICFSCRADGWGTTWGDKK